MASNTPNLNLVKAAGSDTVNLASHINGNWDIIDSKLDASAAGDLDFNKLTGFTSITLSPTNFTLSGGAVCRSLEIVKTNTVMVWYRTAVSSVSGNMTLTLPFTAVWGGSARIVGDALAWDASLNTGVLAPVILASTTTLQIGNTLGTGVWAATAPFTWASGDALTLCVTLERS